jgi:hypothetical protein
MNRVGVPVGTVKNPSQGLTLRRHAPYYAGGWRKAWNRRSLQNWSRFYVGWRIRLRIGQEQFHQLTTIPGGSIF